MMKPENNFKFNAPTNIASNDPCEIFPPEILHEIFSYLDLKDRILLQAVSKSWLLYLTEPHLWASCIDFPRICYSGDKKCNQTTLKKCLDCALLNSKVKSISTLRVGPFYNDSSAECLKVLNTKSFPHPGRSIEEIEIIMKQMTKEYINDLIYCLISTKKLLVSFPTGNLELGTILTNQQRTLETLILSSSSLTWGDLTLSTAYPFVKRLDLQFYNWSPQAILSMFSQCTGLTILRLISGVPLDVSWLCKASQNTKLESLTLEYKFDGWLVLDKDPQADLPQLSGLSRWPRSLKVLNLRRVEWYNLKTVHGTLENLQTLDLTGSKIKAMEFFSRFNCGANLKKLKLRLILNPGKLSHFIWKTCPKLQSISVFDAGIDDKQVCKLLAYCRNLNAVNLGSNAHVTESSIIKLAERGIKRIGCNDIPISSTIRKKLNSLGVSLEDQIQPIY